MYHIVKLEPARIAVFHGFGSEPESEAWSRLVAWAEPLGLLDDPEHHPVYGFNSMYPEVGSQEYGYDFWIDLGDEAPIEPEMMSQEDICR